MWAMIQMHTRSPLLILKAWTFNKLFQCHFSCMQNNVLCSREVSPGILSPQYHKFKLSCFYSRTSKSFHVYCWRCTHSFSLLAIYCLPLPRCHHHHLFFFFPESIILCNFMLDYVSSTRKHMITHVGCNTFSLLNVVAYSLHKPLKIIIGYNIIVLVGLVFC